RFIVRNMTCSISRQDHLMIVGPSGCGKSSLLRVISGLWPVQRGDIAVPDRVGKGGIMFLSQQPLFVEGSISRQICYPSTSDIDQETLVSLLRRVKLEHLQGQLLHCSPTF